MNRDAKISQENSSKLDIPCVRCPPAKQKVACGTNRGHNTIQPSSPPLYHKNNLASVCNNELVSSVSELARMAFALIMIVLNAPFIVVLILLAHIQNLPASTSFYT